jgi:hypothetical protein
VFTYILNTDNFVLSELNQHRYESKGKPVPEDVPFADGKSKDIPKKDIDRNQESIF